MMNDETISRRTFAKGALAGVAATIALPGRTSAAPPSSLNYVDPELRDVAAMIRDMTAGAPPLTEALLPTVRAIGAKRGRPARATPTYEKRTIPGPPGAPAVEIVTLNMGAGKSRPAILHTHGGGFFNNSAMSAIAALQEIVLALDCSVVSVNYRLAPETRYAGSLEDNYAALIWLYDNAADLGIDRNRIVLLGESAGGAHAALLAFLARDRAKVPLAGQVLVYPMLDDRTGTASSPAFPIGSLLWTAELNRFGWRAFLGVEPGSRRVAPHAVPARREDLAGLPPTFIGVGGLDLFVDEDIAYARRLVAQHVPVDLLVVPGAFHGFDNAAPFAAVSRRFTAAKIDALRRMFALKV